MAARKRKETESFLEYRKNLKDEAYKDSYLAKGTKLWESLKQGTYRLIKHGKLM